MFARAKKQVYEFSADVKSVLLAARAEAARLQNDVVGAEHILLALLSNPRGAQMFDDLAVSPSRARRAVAQQLVRGKSKADDAARPYSSEAKDVLATAMAEARQQSAGVALKHLLIGLIDTYPHVAGRTLQELGLSTNDVRDEIKAKDRRGAAFRIQIDDTADLSIFEQIIAQVTQAIAVGALSPGERLPSVRDLADQLDIAPGTVARAYGELEKNGIVVTGGSRGTHVSDTIESGLMGKERAKKLEALLRPVAVAAFHLGASSSEIRTALDEAMRDIFQLGQENPSS